MKTREVIPLKQKPNRVLTLPGSKSITNRAFLCAALAKGKSRIYGALKSDDAEVMLCALKKLGLSIHETKNYIEITGRGGDFGSGKTITLDLHNAGTATRFLTAAMILRDGQTIITGDKRMQERPIRDLVDGLRQIGVTIDYMNTEGCPPLLINGVKSLDKAAEILIRMKGNKSSQYFSALLMLAPCLSSPVRIEVDGELVSKPYIDITLSVLKAFGIRVKNNGYHSFLIKPQHYSPTDYYVEGDASAASYWTSIAALHKGKITFSNLNKKSVQGDASYPDFLSKVGGKVDMNALPDTAMTLAVTAPFFKGQTTITGLSTLRIKETDRLLALETELKKVGVKAKATADSISVQGPVRHGASIATYNDHRMAMCFAVVGTMVPGFVIQNPDCTGKTYPSFWEDLEHLYLSPIRLGTKNLVLTGMRCSGKTYFGKKIARLLKRRFIDLDVEIEKQEKMSTSDIVKVHGWPYFRKVEQKICSKFGGQSDLVIATGGGVVLDESNMKVLKKNALNVFIFADPSVLASRIQKTPHSRPSLTGKDISDEIRTVWRERRGLYLKYADYVWDDTTGNLVDRNIKEIFS